jgi:hypothetical protein
MATLLHPPPHLTVAYPPFLSLHRTPSPSPFLLLVLSTHRPNHHESILIADINARPTLILNQLSFSCFVKSTRLKHRQSGAHIQPAVNKNIAKFRNENYALSTVRA